MTKPGDGRDSSQHLLSPPCSAWSQEFSAGGSAACVFAILWFRVFWATASVIEVVAAPVLRWLVTLGLISWIVFILFFAVLSGLSWVRRALQNRGLCPRYTRCLAGLPAPWLSPLHRCSRPPGGCTTAASVEESRTLRWGRCGGAWSVAVPSDPSCSPVRILVIAGGPTSVVVTVAAGLLP